MRLLQQGWQARHVASTKANKDSSRSHCVFTCTLERKCTEDGIISVRTSCLRLVDLAGELSRYKQFADVHICMSPRGNHLRRSLCSVVLTRALPAVTYVLLHQQANVLYSKCMLALDHSSISSCMQRDFLGDVHRSQACKIAGVT